MSKTTDQAIKDANARLRQCMDKEIVHVRAGDWRGPEVLAVTVVGRLSDLHGTVCTCCPRRTAGAA